MHDENVEVYWIGIEQVLVYLDQSVDEVEYNQVDDVD
jgi:hypothetical protein